MDADESVEERAEWMRLVKHAQEDFVALAMQFEVIGIVLPGSLSKPHRRLAAVGARAAYGYAQRLKGQAEDMAVAFDDGCAPEG